MVSNTPALQIRSSQQYRLTRQIAVILAYAILAVVVFLSLYPVVMLVLNSFKSTSEINVHPSGLPRVWTLENYQNILFQQGSLLRSFGNSVFVSAISTVCAVFLTALAAFAFAKYRFWGARRHLCVAAGDDHGAARNYDPATLPDLLPAWLAQ